MIEMQLPHSKIMILHFAPQTADPKLHGHGDDYQLSIPLSGEPVIERDGTANQLAEHSWCLTPPGERHLHFSEQQPSRILLLNLQRDFLSQVLEEQTGGKSIPLDFSPWTQGDAAPFKQLAEQAMKQAMDYAPDALEWQEWEWELARELFTRQSGAHSERWNALLTQTAHPSLNRVLEKIHAEYGSELVMEQLADLAGVSKFHLIRLFRRHLGVTPSRYVADLRLIRAAESLAQTNRDVTAIAFDAGFGSLAGFERLFKQKYGLTPSMYRKSFR